MFLNFLCVHTLFLINAVEKIDYIYDYLSFFCIFFLLLKNKHVYDLQASLNKKQLCSF